MDIFCSCSTLCCFLSGGIKFRSYNFVLGRHEGGFSAGFSQGAREINQASLFDRSDYIGIEPNNLKFASFVGDGSEGQSPASAGINSFDFQNLRRHRDCFAGNQFVNFFYFGKIIIAKGIVVD